MSDLIPERISRPPIRRQRQLNDEDNNYTPMIIEGLTFNAPLRHDADAIYSANGDSVPAFESEDADGTYLSRFTGQILDAQANTTRIEREGALLEESATNALTYSEELDNVAWTPGNLLIVAPNAIMAPDGTMTGDTIAEDDTAGVEHYIEYGGLPMASDTSHFASIYARPGINDWIRIHVTTSAGTHYCYFNVVTGEVGQKSGTIPQYCYAEKCPCGWYRCVMCFLTGAGLVGNSQLRINSATADGTVVYNGARNASFYGWGAQLNTLTDTSYIPTAAAAVNRAAPILAFNTAGHLNTSSGTIMLAWRAKAPPSNDLSAIFEDFTLDGGGNGIAITVNIAGFLTFTVFRNSAATFSHTITAPAPGEIAVLALTWDDSNGIAAYVNGKLGLNSPAALTAADHNDYFAIGSSLVGLIPVSGNYSHVLIYDRALGYDEIAGTCHWDYGRWLGELGWEPEALT